MPASHNDSYVLSRDPGFQNRVGAALVSACGAIKNEGGGVPYHRERETFVSQVINSPDTYKLLFANTVATDINCLNEATENGTVPLDTNNVAAQAVKVSDGNIDNAISTQFNSFFRTPGS
jgi:hypothetical protein